LHLAGIVADDGIGCGIEIRTLAVEFPCEDRRREHQLRHATGGTTRERIITGEPESTDFRLNILLTACVSTLYSPAGSIEAPMWNEKGTRTKICESCSETVSAANRTTPKL